MVTLSKINRKRMSTWVLVTTKNSTKRFSKEKTLLRLAAVKWFRTNTPQLESHYKLHPCIIMEFTFIKSSHSQISSRIRTVMKKMTKANQIHLSSSNSMIFHRELVLLLKQAMDSSSSISKNHLEHYSGKKIMDWRIKWKVKQKNKETQVVLLRVLYLLL